MKYPQRSPLSIQTSVLLPCHQAVAVWEAVLVPEALTSLAGCRMKEDDKVRAARQQTAMLVPHLNTVKILYSPRLGSSG